MSGKRSGFILFILGVLCTLLALQCTSPTSDNQKGFDSSESLDSVIVSLEYAQNFSIYTSGNDTIIEITDGEKKWKTIVSKAPLKGELKIPLERITCMSTSHLYYFSELGGLKNVQAVSFAENLRDPAVKAAVQNGSLKNLSNGGSEYDAELVLELNPDVFTTYPYGEDEFDRLRRVGISTLHFTEYLEPYPLGRAEWIKLSGFLLGKEVEAELYFDQIRESYLLTKLNALTKNKSRPSVLSVNGHSNKWAAPNGNSLVAHFIKDAGGRYVFENDTAQGNLSLDFERVYELANSSDFWSSVVFSDSVTLNTFMGDEQRLNETEVMKDGRIFYCNAQTRDYFGKGILQPHLILEDVYQVLHPDSLGYEPHYFELFKP